MTDASPPQQPDDLLREIAASGVVHEAEPPGIDYVTIQVDMGTWEAVKRAVEPPLPEDPEQIVLRDGQPALRGQWGAAPTAPPALDVERLRESIIKAAAFTDVLTEMADVAAAEYDRLSSTEPGE